MLSDAPDAVQIQIQLETVDIRKLRLRLDRAPVEHMPDAGRFFPASVILLLFEKDGAPHLLTVLKTDTQGYPWRNQVALPGGHMDETDSSPLDTALRELTEELRICPEHVAVLGSLGHFLTMRQTVIESFLGVWKRESSQLQPDPREISRVIEVPVSTLHEIHNSCNFAGRIPDMSELIYPYDGVTIWGVTARMIHFVLEHVL